MGQQGRFLCLSYHVPVKDTPHLAQTLQTNTRLKFLNYPEYFDDKVWNVITIDLQSFVLWPNFSINWGYGYPSGPGWEKRKFNFIFCGWITVAEVLDWGVLVIVVFGSQAGGESVEGVRRVSALVSLHPARLWRRTLPHFSLITRWRK